MLLTPRYDGPEVLRLEVPAGDLWALVVRQRRRMLDAVAGLDASQWARQSRCEGWSLRDVLAHLVQTNHVWHLSVSAALAGEPTRMMAGFDPVVGPDQQVATTRGLPTPQVLQEYGQTTEALAELVADLPGQGSVIGESPLGHVTLDEVALHALWDAWTHERDMLLPLGVAPAEEPDEVLACLYYVAAIGPALLATWGSARRGTLVVEVTEPDTRFVVEAGPSVTIRPSGGAPVSSNGSSNGNTARLTGSALALVEGLTMRAPLPPGTPGDHWMLTGLPTAFDVLPRSA